MSTSNIIQIRYHNTSLVRRVMRCIDSLTKAQLAQMTGLSIPTCGKILNDMIMTGEAMELDLVSSDWGRPARLFTYNPMFSLVACIFPKTVAGENSIVYEVRDAKGSALRSDVLHVKHADVATLCHLVADLVQEYPAIHSIAVSVPGIIRNGKIGFCDIPELIGVDITGALCRRHNLTVLADNDTNLSALGFYSRRECGDSLVYVVVPRKNCTGAGIVINGEVVRGTSSFAGELSFMPHGVSRERQFAGMDMAETLAYTSLLAQTVIPVLNPSTFVLAAGNIGDAEVDKIRTDCLNHIPEEHLPKFIIVDSMDTDCMKGLDLLANSESFPMNPHDKIITCPPGGSEKINPRNFRTYPVSSGMNSIGKTDLRAHQ